MDLTISLALLVVLIFFGHRRNRHEVRAHSGPVLTLSEQRVHHFFGWSWGLVLIFEDFLLFATCCIGLIALVFAAVLMVLFIKEDVSKP